MKIKLVDIPFEGLIKKGSLDPDFIDEREGDHLRFIKPLEFSAKLNKSSISVFADVKVSGKTSGACARCLEAIENNFNGSYFFDFPLEENPEEIDLGEEIRQEVIANYPNRVLCSGECKGLCVKCGANLNESDCGCPEEVIEETRDPEEGPKHCPFKELKDIGE